jgi:GT2 family glycosyltransferase
VRFLGLEDGRLGATCDLVERLRAELDAFDPELVYAPSPFERHPDHLAAVLALGAALERGPKRRVLLYGVNTPVPGGALFDTTRWRARKQQALTAFESQGGSALARKGGAADVARTLDVDVPGVESVEAFAELDGCSLRAHVAAVRSALDTAAPNGAPARALGGVTAVISTWNKVGDVCANLDGIRAQTRPFDAVVVVDNASSDATARTLAEKYPDVRLIVMPHSAYGACETFNIGFASVTTPLFAILDDDVVLPPEWLEKALERLQREPETTAVLSTEVVEPGMPESYINSPQMRRERYMSTFRGCASLARAEPLRKAGYYDERLFIYGNERDLTCRLLNLGYRVLQYPEVRAFHKTPFGIKMGKRSLYYHARNAWLTMLKYAPAGDLARLPWLVLTRVLLRGKDTERSGAVSDATGTIGIGRSIRETKGAWWVLAKAAGSVLYNVPYCLRHRAPVRAPDFELPLQ